MSDAAHTHDHPTPRKYLMIMIWLSVLTAIELVVVQPWAHVPKAAMILGLIVLAVVKAALVAAYFMHLKMDPRRLSVTLYAPVAALLVLLTILSFENLKGHHQHFVDGDKLRIGAPYTGGEGHEGETRAAPASAAGQK